MPDKPASNQLGMEQVQKPSCSVCWEDFSHIVELDKHIRANHPDRIGRPEEIFARRNVA